MCANNRVVFVCLHITLPPYHHYADVSDGIKFIKCFWGTFLLSSCLGLSQFSQLFVKQYMGLCVFSSSIFLMMIVKIRILYLIVIIKPDVWPVCHCLGLSHETMVCAVCLSIFLSCIFDKTGDIIEIEQKDFTTREFLGLSGRDQQYKWILWSPFTNRD